MKRVIKEYPEHWDNYDESDPSNPPVDVGW